MSILIIDADKKLSGKLCKNIERKGSNCSLYYTIKNLKKLCCINILPERRRSLKGEQLIIMRG